MHRMFLFFGLCNSLLALCMFNNGPQPITTFTCAKGGNREILYHPTSLPITWVKACYTNQSRPQDITNPNPGSQVFPKQQCWRNYSFEESEPITVRISDDVAQTDDILTIANTNKSSSFLFDGINEHNNSILASSSKFDTFALYVLPQSESQGEHLGEGYYSGIQNMTIEPIHNGKGIITALMLKKKTNELAYCLVHDKKYMLNIRSFDREKHSTSVLAEALMPALFTKILNYQSNNSPTEWDNVHLGLTPDGDLYHFWIDEQSKIQYKQQKLPLSWQDYRDPDHDVYQNKKKEKAHRHNQQYQEVDPIKHKKKIWDIAINPLNYLAIINTYGDIYIATSENINQLEFFYTGHNLLRHRRIFKKERGPLCKTNEKNRKYHLRWYGISIDYETDAYIISSWEGNGTFLNKYADNLDSLQNPEIVTLEGGESMSHIAPSIPHTKAPIKKQSFFAKLFTARSFFSASFSLSSWLTSSLTSIVSWFKWW